jgi:hypothetical protein
MKQRKFSGISMPMALTGTTPVMAADPGTPAIANHMLRSASQLRVPNRRQYVLSAEEMDEVHGGAISMTGVSVQILDALKTKGINDLVDLGFVVVCDEGGRCIW